MMVTFRADCRTCTGSRELRIIGTPEGKHRSFSLRCEWPAISAATIGLILATVSGLRIGLLRSATHPSGLCPPGVGLFRCGCAGSIIIGPGPLGGGSNDSG